MHARSVILVSFHSYGQTRVFCPSALVDNAENLLYPPTRIHTCNLPLRPILAPKTDTIATGIHTHFLMQIDQASTEVLPPGVHSLVVFPDIRPESSLHGIVGTVAKTIVFRVDAG